MKGLLFSRLERRSGNPYQPWGNSVPPTNGMLGATMPGPHVSERSAMGVSAVWTANTILSDCLATPTIRLYTGTGENRREIPLSPVIANPFSEITQLDWRTQMQISLGIRGNFYGQIIERDSRGFPLQVMPISPDLITIRRNSDTGRLEYRLMGTIIPIDDVFHVRAFTQAGSPIGLNPIEVLRTTLSIAQSADQFYNQFFSNSAQPGGVLNVPGDLTDDDARQLKQQWQEMHSGIASAHMPAVLTGGISWQQVTMTMQDAQFIESRAFSHTEIGAIYRIPPHMMGQADRSVQATDVEQQELSFERNTLVGWKRRHEIALSTLIPRGQYVEIDLSDRAQANSLVRFQVHQIARNIGLKTPNEIRIAEGLKPLDPVKYPWADNPMAPLNSAQNGAYVAPGDETPVQSAPDTNPNPNAH